MICSICHTTSESLAKSGLFDDVKFKTCPMCNRVCCELCLVARIIDFPDGIRESRREKKFSPPICHKCFKKERKGF